MFPLEFLNEKKKKNKRSNRKDMAWKEGEKEKRNKEKENSSNVQ